MELSPLGDSAVLMRLGDRIDERTHLRVAALSRFLEGQTFPGVTEHVPAYTTIALHYDPVRVQHAELCHTLETALPDPDALPGPATQTRPIDIPVCYEGDCAPDLSEVAAHTGLPPDEVVRLHASSPYRVYLLGFSPGFPFLGGLPERLATPRRASPRLAVPAGSVGIAGHQTGVYPMESPGGWKLIGRTPLRLFDPHRDPPTLLRMGDEVRFHPITLQEFERNFAQAQHHGPHAPHDSHPPLAHVRVLRPGLLTTVQDTGRTGYQRYGIGPGGAMDRLALQTANRLVGNAADAAGLEITLSGPTLSFARDTLIAVVGADLSASAGGELVPSWRPVLLRAGTTLVFGNAGTGCRAWLALAGGIDVPRILGSRSTHLRARFGGIEGRAVRNGDVFALGPSSQVARLLAAALASRARAVASVSWSASARARPSHTPDPTVRVVRGAGLEALTPDSLRRFVEESWRVSPQSDRMGYRLQGVPLETTAVGDMISEPVSTGTVQLPPDGQPIILLTDRQTTGGYRRIAHVITADLPAVAQLRPGDTIRFAEVSLEEAQRLLRARAAEHDELAVSIRRALEQA